MSKLKSYKFELGKTDNLSPSDLGYQSFRSLEFRKKYSSSQAVRPEQSANRIIDKHRMGKFRYWI